MQPHKHIMHRRLNLIKRRVMTTNTRFDIMLVCFHISPPSPATSNLGSQQQKSTNKSNTSTTTLHRYTIQCSQRIWENFSSNLFQSTPILIRSPSYLNKIVGESTLSNSLKIFSQQTQFSHLNLLPPNSHGQTTISEHGAFIVKTTIPSLLINGHSLIRSSYVLNTQTPTTFRTYLSAQQTPSTRTISPLKIRTSISSIGTSSSYQSWQISFTLYLQSIQSKRPPGLQCCRTTRLNSGPPAKDQTYQFYQSSPSPPTIPPNRPFSISAVHVLVDGTSSPVNANPPPLLINFHTSSQLIPSNQTLRSTTTSHSLHPQLPRMQRASKSRKGRETISMAAEVSFAAKDVGNSTARFIPCFLSH